MLSSKRTAMQLALRKLTLLTVTTSLAASINLLQGQTPAWAAKKEAASVEVAVVARNLIGAKRFQEALQLTGDKIKVMENDRSSHISPGNWRLDGVGHALAFQMLTQPQLMEIYLGDIYNLHGLCLYQLKRIPESLKYVQLALDHNPYQAQALQNKGVILAKMGKHDEAIKCFDQLLRQNERFVGAYLNRAEIYKIKKLYSLEQKDLDNYHKFKILNQKQELNETILSRFEYAYHIIKGKPRSPEQLTALGIIHWENLRLKESEESFKQAIQLNPKYAPAHLGYSIFLEWMKRHKDAIRESSLALSLDKNIPIAYITRARARIAENQLPGAIDDYNTLLNTEKSDTGLTIRALGNRAACYAKLARYKEAIEDVNHALSLRPAAATKAELLANRGLCYEKLGDKQQALKDYDSALAANPGERRAYENRGKIMLSMGQYEQAMADLNTSGSAAAEASPSLPTGKELSSMVAHYDKLLKLFPNSTESLYNRGLLQLTLGKPALAAQDLQKVVSLSKQANNTSDYAVCFANIALRLDGQKEKAKELINQYRLLKRQDLASPVVDYFIKGKTSVLTTATSNSGNRAGQTRSLTLLGLDAYASGDKVQAREYLSKVRHEGDTSTDEFTLALSYWNKL